MKFTLEMRTDTADSNHKLWTVPAIKSLIDTSKGQYICLGLGIRPIGKVREAALISQDFGEAIIEIDLDLNEYGQIFAHLLKNSTVHYSCWIDDYEHANETGQFPHIERILKATLIQFSLHPQDIPMKSLPACENAVILK